MSQGCGFMKVIFMLKLIQKKSNAQKNEINETKERKLNCIMKSR